MSIYVYVYKYVFVYIYIYIYIYIYTYIGPTSYICSNVPWESTSPKKIVFAGLTTTTLSRRLTMHLNDSSSIALHLKTHFIPKSKF